MGELAQSAAAKHHQLGHILLVCVADNAVQPLVAAQRLMALA